MIVEGIHDELLLEVLGGGVGSSRRTALLSRDSDATMGIRDKVCEDNDALPP